MVGSYCITTFPELCVMTNLNGIKQYTDQLLFQSKKMPVLFTGGVLYEMGLQIISVQT